MEKKFESKVFCSRRHVDRRRVEDRRLFLKQEYLDHKPERRANMVGRRMTGDRRGYLSRYYEDLFEKNSNPEFFALADLLIDDSLRTGVFSLDTGGSNPPFPATSFKVKSNT